MAYMAENSCRACVRAIHQSLRSLWGLTLLYPLFVLMPNFALSHHAFPDTYNTSRVVEVLGRVIELDWSNPHVEWVVELPDGERWSIESNGIRSLARSGISRENVEVGTRLRVAGFPARNGDLSLYTTNLQLPDGAEFVLRPGSEPRWTHVSPAASQSFFVGAGSGAIEVTVFDGELTVERSDIRSWMTAASDAIVAYYGEFPVGTVRVGVEPADGHGISGTIWAGSPAYIRMSVGAQVSPRELDEDWRLTHEFVHLALPQLDGVSGWLDEGLATYVEPIARVAGGTYSRDEVWTRFIDGMPIGARQLARSGLNQGVGWARTYWGGALFCLLADLEIRRATGQRHGLQHALAGIVAAGGNIEQAWSVAQFLDVADAAVGTNSISRLFEELGGQSQVVDIDKIWQQLGVSGEGETVTYDDAAPGAATRQALVP